MHQPHASLATVLAIAIVGTVHGAPLAPSLSSHLLATTSATSIDLTRSKRSPSPVEQMLAMPVGSISWDETTFEEFVDWLRDNVGKAFDINVIPRYNALSLEGVDRDTPITLHMRKTTVGEIVDEVLTQLTDNDSVALHGENNNLRISTRNDFDRSLLLRVYDVTDLLQRIVDFSGSFPVVELRSGGGGGGVFIGGGGQATDELDVDGDQSMRDRLNDLVEVIQDTVNPRSWGSNDGPGRIRPYGQATLLVLNTIEVHEMIAGFFARHR